MSDVGLAGLVRVNRYPLGTHLEAMPLLLYDRAWLRPEQLGRPHQRARGHAEPGLRQLSVYTTTG